MRRLLNQQPLYIIGAAALAVACSIATKQSTMSRATPDAIIFSHHVHSEQGLECGDCHSQVLEDAEAKTQAIPGKPQCADCHDVEGAESCAVCHRNPDAPQPRAQRAERHLVFSHRLHQEQGMDCEDCHKGAAHWPDRSMKKLGELEHGTCVDCHKKELDAGQCNLCHIRLDLNAAKPQKIFSHEEGFFARHGLKADELERTKSQLIGSIPLSLESTESRMMRIARNQLYFGREVPISEVVETIDRTTQGEVVELAREVFAFERLGIALLGDAEEGMVTLRTD